MCEVSGVGPRSAKLAFNLAQCLLRWRSREARPRGAALHERVRIGSQPASAQHSTAELSGPWKPTDHPFAARGAGAQLSPSFPVILSSRAAPCHGMPDHAITLLLGMDTV